MNNDIEMIPAVVIGYRREENISSILEKVIQTGRRVYVFVDGARDELAKDDVANVQNRVLGFRESVTKYFFSNENIGVGNSVPEALNWVFSFESEVIVLEDDCIPSDASFSFFDQMISKVNGRVALISGSSPSRWDGARKSENIVPSRYPLIWGWATSKASWNVISKYISSNIGIGDALKLILKDPKFIVPFCYFLAAYINIRRDKLKAWDSLIVLNMLVNKKYCLIPPYSMITNIGNDAVASHDMIDKSQVSVKEDKNIPPLKKMVISNNKQDSNDLEEIISKTIYRMRFWNILSPIKALISR